MNASDWPAMFWIRPELDLQQQPQPIAAFFDLDWTLLSVNSGVLWARRDRRLGRISRRLYARAFLYLLAYRLNIVDMQRVMRDALSTVVGETEQTLRQWTREWFDAEVAQHITEAGRRAVDEHRRAGHLVVLLSMTSPYIAEAVAETLDLDATICTAYDVENGLLTGKALQPLCYGPGKVTLARRFAEHCAIDLGRSYFYSDSASDLPMLEAVGFPRPVNPDLHLRLVAWRRGWSTLDWR
ncbi:MAG: HAD family hydrolase [Deltaproteobacteria bacterium]|nr:HAD family hydrolase [Deltaproteobacteria bacterium]